MCAVQQSLRSDGQPVRVGHPIEIANRAPQALGAAG
jgi:hypothetical protein